MKPITDDVVFSIMKGLEKREKRQRASLEAAKIALPDKILAEANRGRVISLKAARERAQRTVNGVFCYVARS